MTEVPFATSDVKQEVKIRLGESGAAAIEPMTVMQMLENVVTKHGSKPALHQKDPSTGKWKHWTWSEYRGQIDAFAKALLSVGFERFDIINIIGFNSPEWFMAHFGAIAAGGVSAGIYTTNGPDACKYISDHSKAKVVVGEGIKQLEKYLTIGKDLPNLKAFVVYGPDKITDEIKSKYAFDVYHFDDFCKLGKDVSEADLKARSEAWKPGQTCSLIYTSGTTGPPKAVMITNDNVTWTVRTVLRVTPKGYMDNSDMMISYLPLSHIAAQLIDMLSPLESGAQIYFAQPDALKGSLGQTLKEVRPTIFFGVPRVFEKIYDKLQEVGRQTTGIKKVLSTWAKSQALEYWEGQEFGAKPSHPLFLFLAKKLLHKAHVALGLDRCEAIYVGAAPIEVHVLKYFASLNLPILELFGQSECTGPHSINLHDAFKWGTVGRPLMGTESMTDPNNGELCYRGRHIFAGYMGMPDKTKETIDPEGWLHSGDVVTIDEDHNAAIPKPSGFIKITGRIKELIITAGGENVPPVLIEEQIKLAMPGISNAMVIGDKRKFLSVILTLQVEVDAEGNPTNTLTGHALETCAEIGSSAKTVGEARDDPKWKEYIDAGIKKANSKATSRAQNVAKWTLVDGDFSEQGGELTPTLKLKRNVAADKYKDVIEKMYA